MRSPRSRTSVSGPRKGPPRPASSPDLEPNAPIVESGQPLSLDEAVALSLRNNLDLEIQRFAPLIAESNRDGAWGAYDPVLNADARYDVQKTPNTFLTAFNPIQVNRDRVEGGGVGIDQKIPLIGADVKLRFDSTSTVTRSRFINRDPLYNSSFFVSSTIPLARGLIWNQPWTQVKISNLEFGRSIDDFQGSVMNTVRGTVEAYWTLVAAAEQVRVAQKSLETARALLEQTRTQYEVGVVSRVEVVESEAGVAEREFQVIQQAAAYRNAQDVLIDAVLGAELAATTTLQLSPTEDPEAYEMRSVDVERAVEQAFTSRPELRAADQQIEQSEVNLKFARNQRLPRFDAELRYGYIGVAGRRNQALPPPTPPALPRPENSVYGNSVDDFFHGNGNENFTAKGVFSIPIPNTAARKQVARGEFELRRAEATRLRLEKTIIIEVRKAARELLASAQGIEAAERARLSAEEQLRAERVKLEHGESTPFEVLDREKSLVEAESKKIDALRAYRSAEIGLERAQGTILDFFRVEIDDVREPTS